MAKKILAVVLAVMMAVSAMAVAVSAAETEITVYERGKGTAAAGSDITIEFTIPVNALYGYMTDAYYLELQLPTYLGGNFGGAKVDWAIVVNGVSYGLGTSVASDPWYKDSKLENHGDANSAPTFKKIVRFGQLTHGFDGKDTTIPVSTGYLDTTSLKIVATLSSTEWAQTWAFDRNAFLAPPDVNSVGGQAYKVYAQVWKTNGAEAAPEDTDENPNPNKMTGIRSYVLSWNPTCTGENTYWNNGAVFVTDEWDYTWTQDKEGNYNAPESAHPLTWDHTLSNKSYIATAESAQLHIELSKHINGQAIYTLYAKTGIDTINTSANSAYWWQYASRRVFVDQQIVDGESGDELVFNVDPSLLYDAYGNTNVEFVIFENITLKYNFITDDYRHVDPALVRMSDTVSQFGSRISWDGNNNLLFDGKNVVYAANGAAHKDAVTSDVREMTDAEKAAKEVVDAGEPKKPETYTDPVTGEKDKKAPAAASADLLKYTWYDGTGKLHEETLEVKDGKAVYAPNPEDSKPAVVADPDPKAEKYNKPFWNITLGAGTDLTQAITYTYNGTTEVTIPANTYKTIHALLDALIAEGKADQAVYVNDVRAAVAAYDADKAAAQKSAADLADWTKNYPDAENKYEMSVIAADKYNAAVTSASEDTLRYEASVEYKDYLNKLSAYNDAKAIVDAYNALTGTTTGNADAYKAGVRAISMKLVVTNGSATEVQTPDEGTEDLPDDDDANVNVDDNETDDGDANVTVDDKDDNPVTGISLAVLPMIIAAAAAVASKRR